MRFISVNDSHDLSIDEGNAPEITSNEVLVSVKAIGVNRADILQRLGKYPPPKGESKVLGLEMSGVVTRIGSHVTDWQVGDRVLGLVPGGAYAEQCKLPSSHLISLPKHWSFIEGASVAEVFLTAYQCLFSIGQLENSQRVLIHAGASGVGTAAIQLAKAKECQVIVTVGSDEKAKACIELGADYAINYNQEDFVAWSKFNVPDGYNVIIDVVAGDYMNKNIGISAVDGHIVVLSMLGGRYAENVDVAKMLQKRVNISATTLRNRTNDYKTKLVNDFMHDFGFEPPNINPVIFTVLPWQKAVQAHQILTDNHNIGKVVLTID